MTCPHRENRRRRALPANSRHHSRHRDEHPSRSLCRGEVVAAARTRPRPSMSLEINLEMAETRSSRGDVPPKSSPDRTIISEPTLRSRQRVECALRFRRSGALTPCHRGRGNLPLKSSPDRQTKLPVDSSATATSSPAVGAAKSLPCDFAAAARLPRVIEAAAIGDLPLKSSPDRRTKIPVDRRPSPAPSALQRASPALATSSRASPAISPQRRASPVSSRPRQSSPKIIPRPRDENPRQSQRRSDLLPRRRR